MIVKITGSVTKEFEPELNKALDDCDYPLIFDLMNPRTVEVEDETITK